MLDSEFTLNNLLDFIRESFEIKTIPETIKKQINRFSLEYNMSAREIARCICYFQEVKKGRLDALYGIWFVPNVREDAANYFRQLELDQQRQAAEAQKVVEYQDNNIIFNIKSLPHKKRQAKQLDITTVNIEGGSND